MSATVDFAIYTAVLNDGIWESNSDEFTKLLQSMYPIYGPSGSDPMPDYNEALRVSKILGGKVIKYDIPKFDKDVVY